MYFMNCLCIAHKIHCLHSVLLLVLMTLKFLNGSVSRCLLFQNTHASEDKGV